MLVDSKGAIQTRPFGLALYGAFFVFGNPHMSPVNLKNEQKNTGHQLPCIIVIGSGPVGIYFINELIKRSHNSIIKVFGDEPWEPYNRVNLTKILSGKTQQDDLFKVGQLPDNRQLQTFWNNRIVSINAKDHKIIDSYGEEHTYTDLILATGSTPRIPNIPGVSLKNVFTFRDLNDVQALIGRQVSSRRTVVIGGGLLGLEAARAMQRFNTEVMCIEHSTRLMYNQLDNEASLYLQDHLEELGLEIIINQRVVEIEGENKVEFIRLSHGKRIHCDTVIISVGIVPNIELARKAGISVGRGIRVDNTLTSNLPNIHAIGECAEYKDQIYGLVSPGYEQAAVLADHLSGGAAQYHGSTTSTHLKVLDYPVFSQGETGENAISSDQYIYQDPKEKVYRKLVIVNNSLRGVVSTGEWPSRNRIQEAIEKQRRIWPWQKSRFLNEGNLWPEEEATSVAEWPATATVCNCTGVTRGTLSQAIQAGANNAEKLCAATGASGVCGSCLPLLKELTNSTELRKPIQWNHALLFTAIFAVVAILTIYLFPGLPYSNSLQSSLSLEILWRDSVYKQITGFTLLALSLLVLLISLRKRLKFFNWGSYPLWRVVHVITGALTLFVIFLHTGFRLGNELNFLLMLFFSALLLLGAIAAGVIAQEHLLSQHLATRLRKSTLWGHILLFWPIPTLLAFHILKTYYF